ncbi:MAG: HNH endonuclease signature motif containing protein [Bacteroidales bacterium]|nr:HNH endonuclease signature motif containing protein [Bacteroidales bacterium]
MGKSKNCSQDSKDEWREDFAGAWICRNQYGNHDSIFGWDVDHVIPLSKNGADDISNWVPLQWENNLKKSDNYPIFQTVVTSDGNKNIYKTQNWKY